MTRNCLAGTSSPTRSSSNARAEPLAPSDRIAAIDVLRGVALLGVMAVNVVKEFRVSIFQQLLTNEVGGSWLDRAVHTFLTIAIDMKALALFSILFGVGLAIQFDQLSAHSCRARLLSRRLVVLLLIGAAHLVLVWNGDILVEYAIAGFVTLAFLYGATQRCALVGLGLLALYVAVPSLISLPSRPWMAHAVAEANVVYATGTLTDVLAVRIRELPGILPLHVSVFPRTVGLMLMGAALWRARGFVAGSYVQKMLPCVAVIGIPSGIVMLLLHASGSMHGSWQALLSFERLATIIVALGYGAGILWAVDRSPWRKLLMWAQPLGRMAFSNYIAQSVIFGFVFYSYGLGLFGKLGVVASLAIGTVVYVLQAVLSTYWLRRYRFGPVEWLWRSAMYGRWQPLRVAGLHVGNVSPWR